MATTVTTTGITFNDATSQSTAARAFTTVATFTASGTWTVPAGVTNFYVVCVGGGGGGGGNNNADDAASAGVDGGYGGYGGVSIAEFLVNGATATVTVGAGGAGTNTGNGGTGGTSSVVHNGITVSATGGQGGFSSGEKVNGADGASGAASGSYWFTGNLTNLRQTCGEGIGHTGIVKLGTSNNIMLAQADTVTRPRGASSTAAVAWSTGSAYGPGARGSGESAFSANDASGGYGGAVFIVY